jgi:hypothetical protein
MPAHEQGKDVLLEALNGPEQANDPYRWQRAENDARRNPPAPKLPPWRDYSEMPAIRGHRSGWMY